MTMGLWVPLFWVTVAIFAQMTFAPPPKRFRRGGGDHLEHGAGRPKGPTTLKGVIEMPRGLAARMVDVEIPGGLDHFFNAHISAKT